MSVLKNRRMTSKMMYITTARDMYKQCNRFIDKMSVRTQRHFGERISRLSWEIMDAVVRANDIYIVDEETWKKRRDLLIDARSKIRSLDVTMFFLVDMMFENPQGCFVKSNGKQVPASEAKARLNNLCENLGSLMDKEVNLIKGVIESDKKKLKTELEARKKISEKKTNTEA